jgi:hypothetical protein
MNKEAAGAYLEMMRKINTQIEQLQQRGGNLQMLFTLLIQFNNAARSIDESFEKSKLIILFEKIQQIH